MAATYTLEAPDAGNYVAYIIGTGDYDGSIQHIPFTVEEFDLTDADITVDLGTIEDGTPAKPLTILDSTNFTATYEGSTLTDTGITYEVTLEWVSGPGGSSTFNGTPGVYTYTVTATTGQDPVNVTGS